MKTITQVLPYIAVLLIGFFIGCGFVSSFLIDTFSRGFDAGVKQAGLEFNEAVKDGVDFYFAGIKVIPLKSGSVYAIYQGGKR